MSQPNILWICSDQQRWDTVAALGNKYINTPNIDRLCNTGVAFRSAYCQSPICTASRASFMTGRYPATTHVFRNNAGRFPASETVAAKLFRDAGYTTGLIGKLHLSNAKGLERRPEDDGYMEFHRSQMGGRYPEHDDDDYCLWLRQRGVDVANLRREAAALLGDGFPADLHQNHWAGEVAIDFVERHDGKPWFLSVHPFDPHHPFDPAPEFHRRYDYSLLPHAVFADHELEYQERFSGIDQQRRIPISPDGRSNHPGGPNDHPLYSNSTVFRVPQPYDSRKIKAAYYAKIEHIDFEVGRIIEALERTGQIQNTIVIFHSDHGELLGDHGLLYKGCRFYDSLVRVPLIFSWPGRFSEGIQQDELVELVDILPSLLEFAHLEIPYGIQGKSLKPMIEGSQKHVHKHYVISHYYDAIEFSDGTHATMTFDGRFKLVLYHNHAELIELFDLVSDPTELDNIWDRTNPTRLLSLLGNHINALAATISVGEEILSKSDIW